jgi:cysteine desulfurase/selenocysteine lyase
MGADFIAFSAHKMCGPTGIGVLWGKAELLNSMPPFLGGGSMIADVRLDGFDPAPLPAKFEAGTPPIAEAVGLGAAINYLSAIGLDAIEEHEQRLSRYALDLLADRFGSDLTIFGPQSAEGRTGLISFVYRDVHPHDLSQVLDSKGVCVRAGHHCAKPLMRHLGVNATARASWYLYNDTNDIDVLADAIAASGELFDII